MHEPISLAKGNITEEKRQQIAERYASGENLSDICKELGLTMWSVGALKNSDPEFGSMMASARLIRAELQLEHLANVQRDLVSGVDVDLDRAKMLVDIAKWKMPRMSSIEWGDRQKVESDGQVVCKIEYVNRMDDNDDD